MRHVKLNAKLFREDEKTVISKKVGRKYVTVVCDEKCYKCGGSGYISSFSQYANGVCFVCKGLGHDVTEYTLITDEQEKEINRKMLDDAVTKAKEDIVIWTRRMKNCNSKHGCSDCSICQHFSYCTWRSTIESNLEDARKRSEWEIGE